MKDVVIKDIKRKTNFDRKVLSDAAILGYSLVREEVLNEDSLSENEESFDFGIIIKTDLPVKNKNLTGAVENYPVAELSAEEETKRRAQNRLDKIRKLRNMSLNINSVDAGSEFEQVPAYLRRDTDLNNSIANVENFYSRSQVKKDDGSDNISITPSIESL